MKILVTGAHGFIGSQLVETLRAAAHDVYSLSLEESSSCHEICCDLSNYDQVHEFVRKLNPNVIFHLAGSFTNDFETDITNNLFTTQNILKAVHTFESDARIITIGSAAEYGNVNPDENPISETHSTAPLSVYGLTKLYQTMLSMHYAKCKGVNVIVARLFNVYGAGASEKLFPGKLQKLIEDYKNSKVEHITIINPTAVRDYLPVEQVAEDLINLMNLGQTGEIYNIGSGVGMDILTLSKAQLEVAGIDNSALEIIDDGSKPGLHSIDEIYADITKFKSLG